METKEFATVDSEHDTTSDIYSENGLTNVFQVANADTQYSAQTETTEDPLARYLNDRTMFCTTLTIPLLEMAICDDNDVPIWCANNPTAIWCPEDPGFEYGGGGSSGGAGAGRTWNAELCFDTSGNIVSCKSFNKRYLYTFFYKGTTQQIPYGEFYPRATQPPYDFVSVHAEQYISCVDRNYSPISCDYPLATSHPWWNVTTQTAQNEPRIIGGSCIWNLWTDFDPIVPCMLNVNGPSYNTNIIHLSDKLQLYNYDTGAPIKDDDNYTDGYPNAIYTYVPPEPPPEEPPPPQMPETDLECANVICQCMQVLANIMHSIDLKTQSLVTSINSIDSELPIFLQKFDELLELIDGISYEVVNEAGTNFWDFLGGAFTDIFDLVEFLIEKIIYLVIPEDNSGIVSAFEMLREDVAAKVEPIHTIQDKFVEVIPETKGEIPDFTLTLPMYGTVEFFDTEFINKYRSILHNFSGGIMILFTAIWAYRKISSEMVT